MVTFTETEENTNKTQIREIENLVRLTFPPQYERHLLDLNGGRCFPNVFSFKEHGKVTSSSIEWFLAIYDGQYDSLKRTIQTFKLDEKRMPTQIIPIANDGLGNLICISCGESDFGKVYFWDHEREVDYASSDDNDYSNLYLIADSFDEFLDGLFGEDVA